MYGAIKTTSKEIVTNGRPVADPGFPVGGAPTPEALRFEKFVCQNERIWTRGGRAPAATPLDPPLQTLSVNGPYECRKVCVYGYSSDGNAYDQGGLQWL